MIVKGTFKKYIGTIPTEHAAARIYDKYSLIIQGLHAKTNFQYTKGELLGLLNADDNQIMHPY